jgi:hypothetical protein
VRSQRGPLGNGSGWKAWKVIQSAWSRMKPMPQPVKLPLAPGTLPEDPMGIAEKIYEVVKDLPEPQAAEILGFAEHVKARTAMFAPAQRCVDLALFRSHRGRYDGRKISREELYDRAGLR